MDVRHSAELSGFNLAHLLSDFSPSSPFKDDHSCAEEVNRGSKAPLAFNVLRGSAPSNMDATQEKPTPALISALAASPFSRHFFVASYKVALSTVPIAATMSIH